MIRRDRFPLPLGHDYVRPAERLREPHQRLRATAQRGLPLQCEPSCAPPLRVELACALGFAALVLWALPDLAVWISSWGICR